MLKNRTERLDFGKMAREAARERDVLQARLRARRTAGPDSPEHELAWRRDNSILYTMYLEQRCNARVFAQRAAARGQGF